MIYECIPKANQNKRESSWGKQVRLIRSCIDSAEITDASNKMQSRNSDLSF